ALAPRKTALRRWSRGRIYRLSLAAAGAAAMLIPVPMTALAPFEIVPRDPLVVTAPLDGVIASVDVAPNAVVARGDRLITFDDTGLRSRNDIAERELRTADARLKRANQLAFHSAEGRRDLAIARAERDVRDAEFEYASLLLSRAVVRSDAAGRAVFNDRKDMIGRPVKTGERLMEIAKPDQVQARLYVPLSDGALITKGAEVRLFLDTDPLSPVDARIVRADFEAKAHQGDQVSFRAVAHFLTGDDAPPRLGIRGTAQIYGPTVPLALYLFRRPLAALRQWIGL
ncbi:MAG: HlyD family efflux transporter periplasmic adaptor subunit, partial [Pseudomonadota bacterium]